MSITPQQPPNTTFTPGWSSFSSDWFSPRIPEWEKFIKPVLVDKPVRWLELGSYEGRSAIWTVNNILTHPDSTIDCVDIWVGEYEANYLSNIRDHPQYYKFKSWKHDVVAFLARQILHGVKYDAIYVDADHQAKSALTDAAMSWPLLKSGGFMIFDDYPWEHPQSDPNRHRKLGPKKGIDAFLECWQYEMKVIHKGYQVIVQKI